MTDLSLPTINHGASAIDLSPAKPTHPQNVAAQAPEEEEDYTIKCICGFYDDDGNTVFCDRCETWQHTECYYFDNGEVPDVSHIDHWCAECAPRRLDARSATERQNMRREQSDVGERKVKKAPTKSHKKKARAPESTLSLANGSSICDKSDHHYSHDRAVSSPKEHVPSMKRSKPTHKYSSSLQSPQLSYGGTERRPGSVSRTIHSPPKTPGKRLANGYFSEPYYSFEFMCLYDDDPGDATMQANLFNDITITDSLSLWRQDAVALAEASNGLSPQDIFHRCEQPLDSMVFPTLHKKYKQGDTADADGRYPRWTLLITDAPLVKNSIVGELKGKIGHMDDYVQDPANRWEYLRHPAPFVFFHPRLPIYIDTRREGTICRYLRRSCHPNLKMTTILENGSDYRFCFVAKDDLEAGSELTVGWTLDQHIRNFFHRRNSEHFKHEANSDESEDYVSDWVAKVLADFGGCACDSPAECSMARYDRRSSPNSNGALRLSNGNALKARNGYTKRQSPMMDHSLHAKTSTLKQQDEEEDDRSTSGSLRSKHRSRETTPIRNSTAENAFAMGLEFSDREKRKIAALERNFEQIEQDKGQPAQKKKKRSSGGTTVQAAATSGSRQQAHLPSELQPNTPGTGHKPQYADASTSRRTSGSPLGKQAECLVLSQGKMNGRKKRIPHDPTTPKASTHIRPNYVSVAIQTDPEAYVDWDQEPVQSQPRKVFMSLSRQLLLRAQHGRLRLEQRLQEQSRQRDLLAGSAQASYTESTSQPKEDVIMHDAEQFIGRTAENMNENALIRKPRPPDEQPTSDEGINPQIKRPPPPQPSNGQNMTGLHVQPPPPVSQLNTDSFPASPRGIAQSPLTARSPFIQSSGTYPPLFPTSGASAVQPSPVKKKVSLGEYMSRRREPSSTGDKPSQSNLMLSQGPDKSLESIEEGKAVVEEGSSTVSMSTREAGTPAEERQDS
ncbi:MAG: hypothetical protein Q9212_000527 [Teloschistes hypoglaucus]